MSLYDMRWVMACLLVMATGCSRQLQEPSTAVEAPASHGPDAAPAESPGDYPRTLQIGGAFYKAEQEARAERLQLVLARWAPAPEGGREPVYHVMNPGERPVLVWNVRQEVAAARTTNAVREWRIEQADYPGRGWNKAVLGPGESLQFPFSTPSDGEWRVCLLYSRQTPDSAPPNARYGGTFEVVGPVLHDPEEFPPVSAAQGRPTPAASKGKP